MCTLLVVEDEATFRDGIVAMIDWGAHGVDLVGAVANGQEAWDLIEHAPPDLLLTDIRMPMMDGLELLERVKHADLPTQVILLSGYGEFEYAKQALKLGAVDYLLKPCRPEEILAVVSEAARSQESRQRSAQLAREQFLCRLMQAAADPAGHQLAVCDGPAHVGVVQLHGGAPEAVCGLIRGALGPLYGQRLDLFQYGEDWCWIGNVPAAGDRAALRFALDALSTRLPQPAGIGVGGVRPALAQVHESYAEARRALKAHDDLPRQAIFLYDEVAAARARPRHRTVEAALKIVAAQYTSNLTLEAVAREVFVSTSYLSTLFKQEMGINFLDYLHQHRIERAKELLGRESMKVFAVARLVGYQDERHFSSTFKKWTGISPSQFQKEAAGTPGSDRL